MIIDDVITETAKVNECLIKECSNQIFLVKIDTNYFNTTMQKYLENDFNSEEIKKMQIPNTQTISKTGFKYCKTHTNEKYGFIIDIIKEWIAKYFSGMILKNPGWYINNDISEYFAYRSQEWFINDTYSKIMSKFNKTDKLKQSLFKIIENMNTQEKFSSEFRWFVHDSYYESVPIYWKKNFILKKYIGQTKEQGTLNGPDFIFFDEQNKETLGFEILELNPTHFTFTPQNSPRDITKVMMQLKKQIESRGGTLINNFKTLHKEVMRKISKWDKYIKTDKKAIGIIMNASVPNDWYVALELLINSHPDVQGIIDWIFFI